MSHGEILVLGAIAGFTIFLGLPFGRVQNPSMGMRAFLNALAIGILVFLFWDVLSKGIDPVNVALLQATNHGGSWLRFAGLAATFAACLTVGPRESRLLRPLAHPTPRHHEVGTPLGSHLTKLTCMLENG